MGRVISTCIQFIDAFSNPSRQTINSMRQMSREARKAGKEIQSAGNVIQSAGKGLTKAITAPVAGVGVAAVKTAADYESAMSNVKAITGATGNDFKQLEQLGMDLGASTAWSAKEVAEAMQYTGMAGWTAADNVNGLKGVLDLASASGTDLARTSDIMTDAISAFGYQASDSAKFADTMTKACTSANVSVETLGESYKYCGAISGTMGYSIEEVTTSLAVMGNMGIKGSQAGTALKNAISNMAAPTSGMKSAMDDLGIRITKQDGSMKSWGEVIQNLQSSFQGLTQDQQAAYAKQLFGKESMAGMLAIINTSTKKYNELSDAIKGSGGAAEEAAKTQLDNLNGQLTLLKSALEGAAITIGNKLTPYLKTAVGWVQKATDWFNGLSSAQVDSIMKWAGIAAAVGPCILVFGKVVTGVGKAVSMFSKITSTIAKFGGILGVITSPAGIVIAVLAAIAAATVLVIKNWKSIKPVLMNVKEWFMDTFGDTIKQAVSGFKTVMKSVIPIIKSVIDATAKIAPVVITKCIGAFKKVSPVLKTVGNAIKAVVPIIKTLLANAFSFLGKTVLKIMPSIVTIAKTIGSILVFAIQKVAPVVIKLGSTFTSIFAEIFRTVSGAVKKMQPVFQTIGTIVKTVMHIVGSVISITFNTAASVISSVSGNIKEIISGVMKVFDGLITFITGIFTANWQQAWEGVKGIFGGIFEALGGLCKVPINAVIGVINNAIRGINNVSVDIPEGIPIVGGKHIGFDIPTIPALAKGTKDWTGGIVQIHEKGGEIVDLPKGSRVYPHDESVNIARKSADRKLATADRKIKNLEKADNRSRAKGDIIITIPKLAEQIIVREEKDIDKLTEKLSMKLRDTAINMGVT
ncbi:MAG: phage tail tape measure protein [Lachnospiraceae bacterium]|nr:phage tail tape measure protein [Lachnospiraceae bacterium]